MRDPNLPPAQHTGALRLQIRQSNDVVTFPTLPNTSDVVVVDEAGRMVVRLGVERVEDAVIHAGFAARIAHVVRDDVDHEVLPKSAES